VRIKEKNSKAFAVLGVDPTQAKLMSVLGIDMPMMEVRLCFALSRPLPPLAFAFALWMAEINKTNHPTCRTRRR
jgi:hypothetical protein